MTEASGIVLQDRQTLLELPQAAFDIEWAQAADGTFGLLYERQLNASSATSATFFQRLTADYAPLGAEVLLSGLSSTRDTSGGGFATTRPDSAIALQPLAEGGFFAVWTLWPDTFPQDNAPNFASLYGRVIAADGGLPADPALLPPVLVLTDLSRAYLHEGYRLPDTAQLADGSIAVTWSAELGGPDGSLTDGTTEIQVARFDPDTIDRLDGPRQANTFTAFNQVHSDVAALVGGGHVVVWTSVFQDSDYRVTQDFGGIYGRIYGADGAPLTPEFAIAADPETQDAPQVHGLADGGFVVLWQEQRGTGNGILMQRYDATGQTLGTRTEVATVRFSTLEIQTATLADGGLLVAWSPNLASSDVQMRRFDAAGDPIGPDVTLQSEPGRSSGAQLEAIVADAVGGFDLVLSGEGDSFGITDTVFLASFAARSYGTLGDDNLSGTSAADVIDARPGNDRLDGNAGNDTLHGGDGTDTLIGGDGDDFLFGGATEADLRDVIFAGEGRDSVEGGHGNDGLHGGGGNDTVLGGFGSDTVIGNAGDDLLAGGAGSDLMFGGPGNDTLNGGFGYDRMNGGDGADRFFHLGVADHGSDWIQDYNAAEGDVLAFGQPGATRSQFQINANTTLTAGADDVAEAFVIYRPTGQIMWALVDGAALDAVTLILDGVSYDFMI